MSVNNLAFFIFRDNIQQLPICLSSSEFENVKDLFYFSLDLFFKGLIIMYSEGQSSITLNDLTADQIAKVAELMTLSHIKPNLSFHPASSYSDETISLKYIRGNIKSEIERMDVNLKIENYVFKLAIGEFIYELYFSLVNT